MAVPTSTSAITQRIDIHLRALAAMVDDLRHADRIWAHMDDAEAASWSMDWFQVVSTFIPELETHLGADEMTPAQRRRYGRLRQALHDLRPTITRLELNPPPIPQVPPTP